MAIDYTSTIGQVRLLIADTSETAPILTDSQISGYLSLNADSVRRAAADALDAIASSETLVSKVIKTQDLSTNGPAVAADLRAHADRLRQIAADTDDFAFAIVYPTTTYPELVEREVWGL